MITEDWVDVSWPKEKKRIKTRQRQLLNANMKILSTPHIPQTIVLHQSYNSKPSSILAMELSSNS